MKDRKPELQQRVLMVDITPWGNYRETTIKEQDEELDASVESTGVIQSVLLRYTSKPGKYELIIGSRRHASSKRNGLTDIPAIIRDLTDEEAAELQLIENIQRADVHPMEEARGFKRLLGFKKGNIQEVSACVGKHASYVARRVKLTDVYEEFQKAFHEGRMWLSDIEKLFKISIEAQKELWGREFKKTKGYIQLNDYRLQQLMGRLSRAPFDTKDATIDPKAGACTSCPLNTAANTLLFPEGSKDATCGNISCFNNKAEISLMLKVKEVQADPAAVIVTTQRSWEGESAAHTMLRKKSIPVITESGYHIVHKPEKKAIESGKYIKALAIDGDNAGKYIYIQMASKSGSKGSNAAEVKEKLKSGKVTASDIQSEIVRLEMNATRKRELTEEAIAPEVYAWLNDDEKGENPVFAENTEALNVQEKIGVIVAFADTFGYSRKDKFLKRIGFKEGLRGDGRKFFDSLKSTPGKIDSIFYAVCRAFILDKLRPHKGSNAQKDDEAAAVEEIVMAYDKTAVKTIRDKHATALAAYEERLKDKLSKLKTTLKELAPAKKPAAKKSPAKKAAKKNK